MVTWTYIYIYLEGDVDRQFVGERETELVSKSNSILVSGAATTLSCVYHMSVRQTP